MVFRVRYASLEGGECLRNAANEAVRLNARSMQAEGKSQDFYAMFDLKRDFVNAWYEFSSPLLSTYRNVIIHIHIKLFLSHVALLAVRPHA